MNRFTKDDKQGIIFVISFMFILAMITFIAYNYQNQYLISTLLFISFLSVAIFLLEVFGSMREDEGQHLGEYRHIFIIIMLVLKGLFISYSLVLISISMILITLLFFIIDVEKGTFNIIFAATFFLAVIFYWIYQKMNVPHKLSSLYTRIRSKKKASSIILNDSPYKKDVVNMFDFLSIFLSVLLLANSTYSIFDPKQITSVDEFFNSFELHFLFYVMPIYVLSAYYRLPVK